MIFTVAFALINVKLSAQQTDTVVSADTVYLEEVTIEVTPYRKTHF